MHLLVPVLVVVFVVWWFIATRRAARAGVGVVASPADGRVARVQAMQAQLAAELAREGIRDDGLAKFLAAAARQAVAAGEQGATTVTITVDSSTAPALAPSAAALSQPSAAFAQAAVPFTQISAPAKPAHRRRPRAARGGFAEPLAPLAPLRALAALSPLEPAAARAALRPLQPRSPQEVTPWQ